MRSTRSLLLFAALVLTSLLLAGLAWSQGNDTPIIIADGSLTMESRGVPWTNYAGNGGTRRHPNNGKTVSAVDVTINGNTQTIAFTGQRCTVTAVYGNTTITIDTGGNGKALLVTTDFNSFHQGATANLMAHNDDSGHMGAITVTKGTTTAFSGTGNGGSRIVIHYQ